MLPGDPLETLASEDKLERSRPSAKCQCGQGREMPLAISGNKKQGKALGHEGDPRLIMLIETLPTPW